MTSTRMQIEKLLIFMIAGTLALGIITYQSEMKQLTLFNQRYRSLTRFDRANQLLSIVKDAETGQRGYLLTGSKDYLTPYHRAIEEIPSAIQNFQLAMAGDYNYDQHIIIQLIHDKLAELAMTIKLFDEGEKEKSIDLVKSGEGRRIMVQLRDILDGIANRDLASMDDNDQEARRFAGTITVTILCGSLLTVVMVIIGMFIGRKNTPR